MTNQPEIQSIDLRVSIDIDKDVWELNYGTSDNIKLELTESLKDLIQGFVDGTGNVGKVFVR